MCEPRVVAARGQHRRHHDQHAMRCRDTAGEIEPRQGLHARGFRHDAVHQRNHHFGKRPQHEHESDGRRPARIGPVGAVQRAHHKREKKRRSHCHDADVHRQLPAAGKLQAGRGWRICLRSCTVVRRPQCSDQSRAAAAEQEVAGGALRVRPVRIVGFLDQRIGRRARELHHGQRHFALGARRGARDLLHRMRDLLSREFAFTAIARQLAQHAKRSAHRLDQVCPFDLPDHAQRRDDVADRQIGRGLFCMGIADQRGAVGAVVRGPADQRRRRLALLDRQPLPQLREVAGGQASAQQRRVDGIEVLLGERRRGIPRGVRNFAPHLGCGDGLGDAAQVFEQHHAQRRR